jgi:hypothetical protein
LGPSDTLPRTLARISAFNLKGSDFVASCGDVVDVWSESFNALFRKN